MSGLLPDRPPLPETLIEIAEFALRAIPGAAGAGLTMHEDQRPQTVVASGEFVHAVDDVQYGLGEGPCLLPDQPGGYGPGAGGQLVEALLRRRGNPDGQPFDRYPCGIAFDPDAPSAWVTIPSVIRAGWWWGTDRQDAGEFFQAEITQALFR